MKTYFLRFSKIIIASVISIAILSLFTLIYNYSGVHIRNSSGATDYTWEPKQWKTTMIEGFAWFRMDENGFNNILTSEKKPTDILLMGSSNMEAIEVAAYESTGYLLNQMLPELYTYNIGMSGHVIYNCVNNMENAVNFFSPGKYVVLETNSVKLQSDDMKKVVWGGIHTFLLMTAESFICFRKRCQQLNLYISSLMTGRMQEPRARNLKKQKKWITDRQNIKMHWIIF